MKWSKIVLQVNHWISDSLHRDWLVDRCHEPTKAAPWTFKSGASDQLSIAAASYFPRHVVLDPFCQAPESITVSGPRTVAFDSAAALVGIKDDIGRESVTTVVLGVGLAEAQVAAALAAVLDLRHRTCQYLPDSRVVRG